MVTIWTSRGNPGVTKIYGDRRAGIAARTWTSLSGSGISGIKLVRVKILNGLGTYFYKTVRPY